MFSDLELWKFWLDSDQMVEFLSQTNKKTLIFTVIFYANLGYRILLCFAQSKFAQSKFAQSKFAQCSSSPNQSNQWFAQYKEKNIANLT